MNEHGGHVIMILDDQSLVRAGMRALIQISEPHSTVAEASSYSDSITLLNSRVFDIVFLDLDLRSEQSGIDVLKVIRANELTCRVIMLSARSEPEIVKECIKSGASGFILKDTEDESVFRRALTPSCGEAFFCHRI